MPHLANFVPPHLASAEHGAPTKTALATKGSEVRTRVKAGPQKIVTELT